MDDIKTWAEREVEIACKLERENSENKDGEWNYGYACYDSALKAFNCLVEDGHSGFSIGVTKYILNRLIEHKPLTPIEDTEDVWSNISDISGLEGEVVIYQSTRMSSLFKYVYPDGSVKYKDINRYVGVSIDNPDVSYHSDLIDRIMDELYPITMPYFPESKPFTVVCEDSLTDPKNGNFDTVRMIFLTTPDRRRIELNRYFKATEDGFVEINKKEYEERWLMHEKRLKENKQYGICKITA